MNEKNNLPSLSQNKGELALSKTRNLMGLVDRLLASEPNALAILKDESWMERLWAWADANGVRDLLRLEQAKFSQLTELDLSHNNFTSLPPEIGQLSQLRVLYLSHNNITSLPPEIGQLSQMTTLGLGNNQLTSLPPEIGQLRQLTWLRIAGNNLTSLLPEIGQLSQMTKLNLDENPLPPSEMEKIRRMLPNCEVTF